MSDDPKERVAGVDGLLKMGKKGVDALAQEIGEEEAEFVFKYINQPDAEIVIPKLGIDKDIVSPLHIAARKDYTFAAELLLLNGAKPNATSLTDFNRTGKPNEIFLDGTPLELAVSTKMKKLLKSYGGTTTDMNFKPVKIKK
ncbi:MAG: hypothetical protein ACYS8W_12540 [Planctomycetota bacterium]|jgi:hypothetical protein